MCRMRLAFDAGRSDNNKFGVSFLQIRADRDLTSDLIASGIPYVVENRWDGDVYVKLQVRNRKPGMERPRTAVEKSTK